MARKNAKITTIEQVKEYAMENYNNGGDGIVECYEDFQIQEILDFCSKNDKSVRKCLDGMFYDAEQVRLDRQGAFEEQIAEAEEQQTTEEIKVIQKEMKKPKKKYPRTKKSEMQDFDGVKLTPKQMIFISKMQQDDFYEAGLDSTLWVDIYADRLEQYMSRMAVGAMVSTLQEKGLISVGKDRREGKTIAFFSLTEEGKKIGKQLGLK